MATLHCGPASCDTSSVKHRSLQMLIETRAADAGDPATNPRGGRISRWAVSADVGHCSTPPCGGYRQSGQWASLKRADQCSEERFPGHSQATQSQATALYTDAYHLWLRITPGKSACGKQLFIIWRLTRSTLAWRMTAWKAQRIEASGSGLTGVGANLREFWIPAVR